MLKTCLAAAALALLAQPAAAHVAMAPATAQAGTTYVGGLRVSHGCDGSATVKLRVEIPASVLSAKPQLKAGWTITIDRAPLPKPVTNDNGKTVTDRVSAITWTGRLPDEDFDDFVVLLRLPKDAGPLYLPAVQTCETGSTAWTDIPAAGQAWHDVPHPAPMLTLQPAGADLAGMDHSKM